LPVPQDPPQPPQTDYFKTSNWQQDEVYPHLSEAQLRVMVYLNRRIFGFGKTQERVSAVQIASGWKPLRDQGAGLAVSTVRAALDRLIELRLVIEVEPNDPRKNQGPVMALQQDREKVNWELLARWAALRRSADKTQTPSGQSEGVPSGQSEGVPSGQSEGVPSGQSEGLPYKKEKEKETRKTATNMRAAADSANAAHANGNRAVVASLASQEVPIDLARELCASPEGCRWAEQHLAWLPFRVGLENPVGYLIAAIRGAVAGVERYRTAPSGYVRDQEQTAKAEKQRDRTAAVLAGDRVSKSGAGGPEVAPTAAPAWQQFRDALECEDSSLEQHLRYATRTVTGSDQTLTLIPHGARFPKLFKRERPLLNDVATKAGLELRLEEKP
jgi:hypothetical protein